MVSFFYNALWVLCFPLFFVVGVVFCVFSEKRRETFFPRLGFQDFSVFRGLGARPLWVHALSVGEVRAAAPLVHALCGREGGAPVVVSASTMTGFQTARELFGGEARAVFYFPFDFPLSVRRVLRRVNPALLVLVETDLWPNVIRGARKRGVPVILTNARLSHSSLAGYKKFWFLARHLFLSLSTIGVQTRRQKDRFIRLGVPGDVLRVTGNLKFEGAAPEDAGGEARERLGVGPETRVLTAGSTHPGEEALLADMLPALGEATGGDLLLIVAPRDPKRAGEAAEIFSAKGVETGLFSSWSPKGGPGVRVLVVDVMGELVPLYGAANVCFVGGSLLPFGGHNPLEPAGLGRVAVFGPHMSDFSEIAEILADERAAVQASDPAEAERALAFFLSVPEKADEIGARARAVVLENQGAVESNLQMIRDFLP